MKNTITTKDLQSLDEMMILENWIATKFNLHSGNAKDEKLKKQLLDFAKEHLKHHEQILSYAKKGGEK